MSIKKGKKKWIIVGGVAAVLVAVVGVAAFSGKQTQTRTQGGTVAFVEKRTIANSISGNGVVEAADKTDITGGSFGMEVKKVYVQEGDVVAVGDIICVFDTTDLEERIASLQEDIREQENNRATQNAEYDQQIADSENTRMEQLNTANANLSEAQATLAEETAELEQMQKDYDTIVAENGNTVTEAIQMQNLINAQKGTVDAAQSRVDLYKDRVDALGESNTASISERKENYNDQVTNSVEAQQEQIENLHEQIENATIRSTIAGVVTSVNVTEGSSFNGGTIASIESADDFIIEAQIEEYDIPDIATGMKVLIKTDATREEELEGVVTYVAPRATNSGSSVASGFGSLLGGMDTSSFTSSSGSATYLVKIALNQPNERLRLGMNAKVSIIEEERVDTWSVSYDAVYTREDGSTYVECVTGKDEDGNLLTRELDVEVGIQGNYYVEIISNEIGADTQILIPDAQGNSSIEELLNMMGADAGI